MQLNRQNKLKKNAVQFVLCFAVFFLMLLGVLNRSPGFTDESDNFIGGMVVASGGQLYKDFVSQHMPVMYYICAVLKLLGADSVYEFRILFYVVLAIMWAFVAVYYKNQFGHFTTVGTGVFYITNMFTFYTCCILAEQIQSICFVALLLEFLLFAKNKTMNWKNCLMISGAIFLSFGSAFVSAFPIFVIALAFLVVEIQECVREKIGFLDSIRRIWNKFWKLLASVLAPFVILLIIYAAQGMLSVFFYSAYTVNRRIYPDYISGYGSSIVMSFIEPVGNYAEAVICGAKNLILQVGITKEYLPVIRQVICYTVNIIFWIDYARKTNFVQALLIAYFTMMCGSRGFTHEFHSLPYIAVTMFMAAYLIQKYVIYLKNILVKAMVGLVTIVYVMQYVGACRSVLLTGQNLSYKQKEDENNIAYWIHALTDEREKVLLTTIEPQILVEADRIPYRTGVSAPWMYEAFEDEELDHLKEDAPRVAVYTPEYNIWGYALTDYAPDFAGFMAEHYTLLDEGKFPELYIRNDYLDTARDCYQQ